jgi:stearoyl-CoA desaturase (delta-9 desaturase)
MSTITAEAPPPQPASAEADPGRLRRLQVLVTVLLVFGPLVALGFAGYWLWGHGIGLLDVVLALALYFVVGFGVTTGFHRLLAHGSFEAKRPLRITLTVAGSLAFQGGVIGWVANHRRHHSYTERAGDPHSPFEYGTGFGAQLRALWHAHMGWFFEHNPNSESRFAPDLLAERDVVIVNALFPIWCVVSLALPFALGWLIVGTLSAALTALLWAGVVRICLLQHVTWSINSICHTFGSRPFRTRDHSTNFAPLAIVSMGEAWHNNHHAFPTLARHGVDHGQLDGSAVLIRLFERAGWASKVHWPQPAVLDRRRVDTLGDVGPVTRSPGQ